MNNEWGECYASSMEEWKREGISLLICNGIRMMNDGVSCVSQNSNVSSRHDIMEISISSIKLDEKMNDVFPKKKSWSLWWLLNFV